MNQQDDCLRISFADLCDLRLHFCPAEGARIHLPDFSALSTMNVYPHRWEFRDIYDPFSRS